MAFSLRPPTTLLFVAAAVAVIAPQPAAVAAAPAPEAAVGFVVLREAGTGSASQAQGPLDALLAHVAVLNAWPAATGKYFTDRKSAQGYIDQTKPHFGMLSFGGYLAMRKASGLVPVATTSLNATGSAQYFIVSKTQPTVAACKGKTLATNHASDAKFIDAVVSGADFDLGDFEVVPTRRPVQTLKAVINGEAECALIDDAQVATMYTVDGGAALLPLWSSPELPALVVVAFGGAPADEVASFTKNVGQICDGAGKAACGETGLQPPQPVKPDAFAERERQYGE